MLKALMLKYPNNRIVYIILLCIKVLIIALPNGLNSKIDGINVSNLSSPEQIRMAIGMSDPGWMLEVAISWSNFEPLDRVTQSWIVGLWSPGLAVIETTLIWLNHILGAPIFWSILFITIAIWIYLFYLIIRLFTGSLHEFIVFLIIFAWLDLWDFKFMFREQIFMSEGISYGLLLIGLVKMSIVIIHEKNLTTSKLFSIGGVIGVAIWVRSSLDLALFISLFLCLLLKTYFKFQHSNYSKFRGFSNTAKSKVYGQFLNTFSFLVMALLIALFTTMPWRIISSEIYGNHKMAMSSSFAYVGQYIWVDNKDDPNFYWKDYGMNWACEVDPEKCAQLKSEKYDKLSYRDLAKHAVLSAISHPIKYLEVRGQTFYSKWFAKIKSESDLYRFFANLVLLLIPFSWIFLLKRVNYIYIIPIIVLWTPFILVATSQLLIIHYESRYFIIIRSLFLLLTLVIVSAMKNSRIKYD
jgi:hypothetical protein